MAAVEGPRRLLGGNRERDQSILGGGGGEKDLLVSVAERDRVRGRSSSAWEVAVKSVPNVDDFSG